MDGVTKRGRRSPGRTASRPSAASSGTASLTDRHAGRPYVVILAGGAGTRLWPLARRRRPKPFLPLFGGRSLFGLTWARARALAGASRVIVVCGEEHAPWVRQQARGLP